MKHGFGLPYDYRSWFETMRTCIKERFGNWSQSPLEPSFDLCLNSVYGTELIKLGLLNTGMSVPAFLGFFNAMTA